MKIITQGLPTTSKILPKPPGGSSGSPVVVMSSAQPSITMVTKTASSIAGRCKCRKMFRFLHDFSGLFRTSFPVLFMTSCFSGPFLGRNAVNLNDSKVIKNR